LSKQPNVIVVMSDTLRTAELACYFDTDVQTPNLSAFAQRSVRFTRAYPESLPTIPVRRALHTGRRAYPFRDYRPVKWDIVYLPGWQAIDNEEDTLAENLAAAGYQTGFVADSLPYFAPGFNFQRGFWQWEYVRGKQQDRWRSPYSVPDEVLARYGDPAEIKKNMHGLVPMHTANTAHFKDEGDTCTARSFKWGMQFLEDNVKGQPFYLLVDVFDPHEPWDAPDKYYRLYADPNFTGKRMVHCGYAPVDTLGYTEEQVRDVHANYKGLVSLVDTWFGKLIEKMDALGLSDNTYVFFTSDHGTNFCDNPRRVIGKPANAMYPGVMHLPLLVRTPDEARAGECCDELVYNIDLTATVYDVAGAESEQGIDGRTLVPLVKGTGPWERRPYLTCRYGDSLCYIDDASWVLSHIDRRAEEAFDVTSDPRCRRPLDEEETRRRFPVAWERLLGDAGGEFPDYRERKRTDAIGQKPQKGTH